MLRTFQMALVCLVKPRKSDDLWKGKVFITRVRNMETEDTEICQITLTLTFRGNVRNRLGSLVCPPAPQHVLDVPLTHFTKIYEGRP